MSDRIEDGGPAFPFASDVIGHTHGMTLRAKLEEATAVLGWYTYQFCEGFCEDFPSDKYTDENCDLNCSGCKARATLAEIKGADK